MGYYILDLSPANSLVKYLLVKGHTVFMVSWKNLGTDDRNLGMDDYHTLDAMAAINAVSTIAARSLAIRTTFPYALPSKSSILSDMKSKRAVCHLPCRGNQALVMWLMPC